MVCCNFPAKASAILMKKTVYTDHGQRLEESNTEALNQGKTSKTNAKDHT